MKSKYPTKPIYGDMIEAAASALIPKAAPETFNRLERKDFWNDPDRWEGIDDPHKTMIWELRRPDRIDVGSRAKDEDALRNTMALEKARYDAQSSLMQSQLRQSASYGMYLNQWRPNPYGFNIGSLFSY